MKNLKSFFYIFLIILLLLALYFQYNAGDIYAKIGNFYYKRNNIVQAQNFYEKSFKLGNNDADTREVYINTIIYLAEYKDDGLTKAGRKLRIQNPLGGMLHGSLYFSKRFKIKYRVKGMMLYICYGLFAGKSLRSIFKASSQYNKPGYYIIGSRQRHT